MLPVNVGILGQCKLWDGPALIAEPHPAPMQVLRNRLEQRNIYCRQRHYTANKMLR